MRWQRLGLGLGGMLTAILVAVLLELTPVRSSQREAWLVDFDRLIDHTAVVYANLEWAVDERGIDPSQLAARTRRRLRSAWTVRGGRAALQEFVLAWRDPHFRTEPVPPPPRASSGPREMDSSTPGPEDGEAEPLPMALSAADACRRLGYRRDNLSFRLDFEGWDRFTPHLTDDANPFPAGVLALDDGRSVGVLRIAEFGEERYLEVAIEVFEVRRGDLEWPCGPACRFHLSLDVANRLLEYIADRLRALESEGVDAILLDITQNGGGTDWAGVAPRLMTEIGLRCPPEGFIKHEHALEPIRSQLEQVRRDLEDEDLSDADRQLLDRARTRLLAWLSSGELPCDRSALFTEPSERAGCSQVVHKSGCGAFDYLPPGSLEGVPSRRVLFHPFSFDYTEGVWTGPLLVLVDRGTASAAEQFATLLQANDAATVVGERTAGAGCGYTNGGLPIDLRSFGLRVRMSDCVRYRADGQNELEGVEPDIVIWDAADGAGARLRKLVEALDRLVG